MFDHDARRVVQKNCAQCPAENILSVQRLLFKKMLGNDRVALLVGGYTFVILMTREQQ